MRGTLFFTGVCVFALGVLLRTLVVIPWHVIALIAFVAALCFGIGVFERVSDKRSSASGRAFSFGCIILAGVCGIVRTSFAPQTIPEAFEPLINTHVSLTGAIVADPDVREKNQQLFVLVQKHTVQTKVLVFAPPTQIFAYGEEVTISGVLTVPAPFSTDTGRIFRYDHYLAKKDIFSDIPRAEVIEVAPAAGFIYACADTLFGIKHAFVQGVTQSTPRSFRRACDRTSYR
jgi:hypothetical protein